MLFYRWQRKLLMDKANPEGASGGTGGKEGENDPLKDLRAQNESLLARLEALEKNRQEPKPEPKDDPTLADKARKDQETKDQAKKNQARLEAAIQFSLKGKDWAKTHASILPKTIESVFNLADKENYDSATEKDGAIKSEIINEFFSLQENLDLLTENQKNSIAEFKALTKNSRQERAHDVYNSIFEPTFEMLKRIKKAEQLNRGLADQTESASAYKEKLLAGARKKFLGEK